MDATTYGFLVLAFPLAGSILIACGWKLLPGRSAGWIGTGAILLCLAPTGLLNLDHIAIAAVPEPIRRDQST